MAENKKIDPTKVNPVSLGLNITIVLIGMLISLCSLLLIWNDKDLGALYIHIINHMIIYAAIIFYSCYGYKVKKFYIIRIIAGVFAVLSLTSAIIFLANSDFAVPMSIFNIFADIALIYFVVRINHKLESEISLAAAILLYFVYGIVGVISLDIEHDVTQEYRFFTCISLFSQLIVVCSISHSLHITKTPREHILNEDKKSEIKENIE